ncbi:hypothetical protein FRC00_001740 [Tulasnella sp. 408]|nr:hypothetical protein FRC00_001740 [Tulasnella sp. 408]
MWGRGLTPLEFWKNIEHIRRTDEEDMPGVVDSLVSGAKTVQVSTSWIPITRAHSRIMLASTPGPSPSDSNIPTIYVTTSVSESTSSTSMLVLPIPQGKAGQKQFMEALPRAIQFAARNLDDTSRTPMRVAGESELDAALGIAMVLLEALFDSNGVYIGQLEKRGAS